ncbi:hypothetical protein [Tumebacillus permanentifrigoris]|uniref:Uncharacterized protein n=1 Tax=Tumebacillus permanentifrigoris TaxID=378543 RepID=A0A316D6S6_9BACL|nr:hypothetical protein [Tumebacillus permanentifrigoris]PWK07478.1 hypothetical protein C7459_11777 [Tumebacillus permanentifrigoris]
MKNRLMVTRQTGSGVSVAFLVPPARRPVSAPVKESAVTLEEVAATSAMPDAGADVILEEMKSPVQEKPAVVPAYRTFQLIPHASVKNENIEHFTRVIADSYRELWQRWSSGRAEDPDRIFFETVLEPQSFRTYITTNSSLYEQVQQHARSVWRNVTLADAECPASGIEPGRSTFYELRLARPAFLSLKTDRRMQETPLAQIAELTRGMSSGDRVVLQIGMQAAENSWGRVAERAREEFAQAKKPRWWGKERALHQSSEMKTAGYGFDTVIRITVTSDDERRRRFLANGVRCALKQLDQDNVLVEKRVWRWFKARWLRDLQRRRLPVPLRFRKRQILTGAEIAHFVKLPQRALQEEYSAIDAVTKPEVSLPDELFLADVPGIDIGTVVERGSNRTARVPLKAFGSTSQEQVNDAYCLPEFVFGEQGGGKTSEAKHRAHAAITNGQTVFFFDTADGAAVRELQNTLPTDYPPEKIIHIDLTNKAWPVALRWAFDPKFNEVTADAELEAEKSREAGRMFLRQFVAGIATDAFTDRMERYLASVSRAAGSAPLDIELALNSPAYREELLSRPDVAAQLDIALDLQALQDKARRGSEDISRDGIMSRLRALSSDRFRTNLFYQQPVEPLDFRKYADNEEGGYGYCVTIYCDKSSFGPDGQEAIMTYMLAKVLLEAAYSRVDIADRSKRKPFVVLLDEPHRFIRGEMATKLGEDAAVELRKYRCKLVMFGHSRAQLGKLWDAFQSGGIQVTMYKSKDVQAFKDLAAIIAPLDPVEAWRSLGQYEAVVTKKLPSKTEVAFIAKMCQPPAHVQDRTARREACARQFGRPWKEVSGEIQRRRVEYAQKDSEWLHNELEKAEESEAEKKERRKRGKAKEKTPA